MNRSSTSKGVLSCIHSRKRNDDMKNGNKYLSQFDVEFDKFDRLPRVCLALAPGGETPIRIVRGVSGYFPVHHATNVARFNDERGITEQQVEAMLTGSMFGWECPGADPLTYSNQ